MLYIVFVVGCVGEYMFYHKGITLFVPDKVYYPREDSLLLADVLEKAKVKGDVLDIGCGSGLLALLMAKSAKVTATDVCSLAVKTTLQNAALNKIKFVEIPINYKERIGESSVTGSRYKAFVLGLQMLALIVKYRFGSHKKTRSKRKGK